MTPEDLMKRRYKVIADYPGSRFEVGDILYKYFFETSETGMYTYTTNIESPLQGCGIDKKYVETMPHLFKKMEWWEDRTKEDMPEYLNCPSRKMFFKVEYWGKSYFVIDGRQKMQYRNYIPATREEYEQYNKQKDNE